jgi:hypothetical protein
VPWSKCLELPEVVRNLHVHDSFKEHCTIEIPDGELCEKSGHEVPRLEEYGGEGYDTIYCRLVCAL